VEKTSFQNVNNWALKKKGKTELEIFRQIYNVVVSY
jgi:hypothetical protein